MAKNIAPEDILAVYAQHFHEFDGDNNVVIAELISDGGFTHILVDYATRLCGICLTPNSGDVIQIYRPFFNKSTDAYEDGEECHVHTECLQLFKLSNPLHTLAFQFFQSHKSFPIAHWAWHTDLVGYIPKKAACHFCHVLFKNNDDTRGDFRVFNYSFTKHGSPQLFVFHKKCFQNSFVIVKRAIVE